MAADVTPTVYFRNSTVAGLCSAPAVPLAHSYTERFLTIFVPLLSSHIVATMAPPPPPAADAAPAAAGGGSGEPSPTSVFQLMLLVGRLKVRGCRGRRPSARKG